MAWPTKSKTNQRFYYMKNSSEVSEYLKCQKSIVYFILTYLKITHPVKGKIPFKLFPFQMALLKVYLMHRYSVTLKPRQMGISTLVAAYALWLILFHPYKVVSIISIKESIAKNLLRKIKLMYNGLPEFLRMEVAADTAVRMSLVNGSEINVESATENAGRSEALSCLIMDEVAFQRYAGGIWASAQPTLSTGGQAILLSTAFGIGNFFHETYTEALQRLNGFFPVRLTWQMHPERNIEWYHEQVRSLGLKRVAQEVDCDFLQSGFTVFDMGKIKAIEDRLLDTVPLFEYGMNGKLQEGGPFKIFFPYDPNRNFFIGADVASGRARDYSAFGVFDDKGKQYGSFKGKIGIRDFGHLMMKAGQMFGNAVLAPESNAIGEGVISVLQENSYPNIYTDVSKVLKLGDNEFSESETFGWFTTGRSRNEMISGMDDDLTDDAVELINPYFVEEAYTFIYNQNNRPVALGKEIGRSTYNNMYDDGGGGIYCDDAIIADCIGNEVRKRPMRFRGFVPLGNSGLVVPG